VVVPIGNKEPDAGIQVTGREPFTASLAETVKVTVAPEAFDASTVMSDGSVSVGGVVSATVTMKLPFAVFP